MVHQKQFPTRKSPNPFPKDGKRSNNRDWSTKFVTDIKGRFPILSGYFFAKCITIFHKTEVQTVILKCGMGLLVQKLWQKKQIFPFPFLSILLVTNFGDQSLVWVKWVGIVSKGFFSNYLFSFVNLLEKVWILFRRMVRDQIIWIKWGKIKFIWHTYILAESFYNIKYGSSIITSKVSQKILVMKT